MVNRALDHIRIILVEPAGPLNIGSVARIMKNMGLHRLVVVNPHCDPRGEEAQRMAVHALEVLLAAQVVETLPEALTGCQRAIATTSRDRVLEMPVDSPKTGLPWLLGADPQAALTTALIFGPEDRGLSNQELNYASRCIRIPSSPDYPSLNLAQAVAVCCYELYQLAHDFKDLHAGSFIQNPLEKPRSQPSQPSSPDAAPLDALEGYFHQLESVLLRIGYLYPHTAQSRMEKFRRLFNRAELSTSEVAMLRGILSQVEWAVDQTNRGAPEAAKGPRDDDGEGPDGEGPDGTSREAL